MADSTKKKEGISRLMELASANRMELTFACLLSVLSSLFKIVPFFTIYLILQKLISIFYSGKDFTFESVSYLVYITAASALLYGICAYSSAMISHGAAFDILYDLRMKLMEKMGKISSGYYTSNTQGSIKKLLIDDVEQIEIFIAHSMCEVAAAIATPVFTIIVLFITDWRLTLVSLIPILCSFVIPISVTNTKKLFSRSVLYMSLSPMSELPYLLSLWHKTMRPAVLKHPISFYCL